MVEIGLGLLAAFAWGFHDFFVRIVVRQINIFTALFFSNCVGIFGLVSILVYFKEPLFISQTFLLISILYGLLFITATCSLFLAFQQGPVFVAAPIICSYPLLSLLYAALLGAPPTTNQWLLSGLVIFGLSLTVFPQIKKDSKKESGIFPTIFWSVVAAVLFSLAFYFGQNQIVHGNEISSNLLARLTAIVILYSLNFGKSISLKIRFDQILILVFMGFADTFALTLMVYSGNFSNPEFSSVSASIFGLITIILVCIFYRERLSVPQVLGVGLVFLSIGILSLG